MNTMSSSVRKPLKKKQPKKKIITEKDLQTTFFVPKSRMNEVIDLVNVKKEKVYTKCDYSLLSLKRERSTRQYYDEIQERYAAPRHLSLFVSTCYKAIYAHDWDRLLYILKKVPRWKFYQLSQLHLRLLTILLMYHPESQQKGYFNEYLHMVWGCRLDSDKKAIQKTLLTLCKRMFRNVKLEDFCRQNERSRKQAFADLEKRNKERIAKEAE